MRAAGARAGGLHFGVGLPLMRDAIELDSVLLFLSSQISPLARVFELWEFDKSDKQLQLRDIATQGCDATRIESQAMRYMPGEGLVGRVWETGRPWVTEDFVSLHEQTIGVGPRGWFKHGRRLAGLRG